ncbi:MAG: hypothetical protein LBB26_04135 [Puniceicoccales bacterium]|nr:hypothetical protein [Puniceicoccales bacterium]
MKNTAAFAIDIFKGDWELRMSPILSLSPGFKLELSFSRGFPASLGRASPLQKLFKEYHQ